MRPASLSQPFLLLLLSAFSLQLSAFLHATPIRDLSTSSDWRLLLDEKAEWQNDTLYLPDEVDLAKLPVNAPTGGWSALTPTAGIAVTLPSTVEEHFWGKTASGLRPYKKGEYFYWDSDPSVKNGTYLGVSWWYTNFSAPDLEAGQRLLLHVRGARLRTEVYLNEKLVGYNLITEIPFTVDLTPALENGNLNQLAFRITNPGGYLDWCDWDAPIKWGKYDIPRSHGFGGLDAGLTLEIRDPVAITDLAVLNNPNPREITFLIDAASTGPAYRGPVALNVTEKSTGQLLWSGVTGINIPAGKTASTHHRITLPDAKLWDLDTPHLYTATATLPDTDTLPGSARVSRAASGVSPDASEIRTAGLPSGLTSALTSQPSSLPPPSPARSTATDFGFRWFAPEGIHHNAHFRLNGRRIVIKTAISWGYWPYNGLFPTDALAEKEVLAAKKLGLNCLQFHRKLGRPNVLDAHDRLGLLRLQEPGAGKNAYTPLDQMGGIAGAKADPTPPTDVSGLTGEPTEFRQRYQVAKILAMVRRDRSHPSLIIYCLQNEQNPPLTWPAIPWLFRRMQEIDPSRTIYLHSGIPTHNQFVVLPYQRAPLHEDGTRYSGWYDQHTVGGPGIYTDELYTSTNPHLHHRTDNAAEVVTWGEMLGVGVPDDHEAILAQLKKENRTSYDNSVRENALAATNQFLDRWGFRTAFPTASSLYRNVGEKSYHFWAKIMEQARACDLNDSLVLSGWESTTIENHAGLVDTFRNFRTDPKILSRAMGPELLVVRPHRHVLAPGDEATVDLLLVDETPRSGPHQIRLTVTHENLDEVLFTQTYPVEIQGGDIFGQTLVSEIKFPVRYTGQLNLRADLLPHPSPITHDPSPILTITEPLRVVAKQSESHALIENISVLETGTHVTTALKEVFSLNPSPITSHPSPTAPSAAIIATGSSWRATTQYIGDEFTNAPDKQLYRNFAYGPTGIIGTWDGLATGLCKVELFLGEPTHTAPGKRSFDLALNGQTVLRAFDPFKESGGKLRAIVKTFDVDLPSGSLTVSIPQITADRAALCGMRFTDSAGKTKAIAFRNKPYTDQNNLTWSPFALAGMTLDDALLDSLLQRVERDGLRLIFWTNGMPDAAVAAEKLAARGIVKYAGPVAEARASWMGSWYFNRAHWLFDGLPVNQVFDWQYQVPAAGPGVGALLLEEVPGKPLEVMVGYARDHEDKVGAACATIRHGKGLIILPSIPGLREALTDKSANLTQPIAHRLLGNALRRDLP